MDFEYRTLVMAVLLVGGALFLASCTAIGTGRATLIRADRPVDQSGQTIYTGREFDHLLVQPAPKFSGKLTGKISEQAWGEYRRSIYGNETGTAANIAVSARDQSVTPAIVPLDAIRSNTGDIAKVLLDPKLSAQQKDKLIIQLRDSLLSAPESPSRLVQHGQTPTGSIVYHYFPQLTLDLTGTLQSADALDRFDFIAAAIRIPGNSKARFINFAPKAADLFDFTLGQLKQSASATAKADAGRTGSDVEKAGSTPAVGSTAAQESTRGASFGAGLNFALSDELTRDLRSSLEARSAGILDNGKLFLVELRSNDQRRIAGTYNFDVMLEVPSDIEKSTAESPVAYTLSNPQETEVMAEVRVVGIIRHVARSGQTGIFKKAPEPLNDDVFREVVVRDMLVPLWSFNNIPLAQIAENFNLTVLANEDDASFSVLDEASKVIGYGTGRFNRLSIPAGTKARIAFNPINRVTTNQAFILEAPAQSVEAGATPVVAVGAYTTRKPE
ncbi:hypothetical protein FHS79_002991 [Polymorphobacter multimanifer]|uniref:Uncharacterized protein n=1 Tax=Polymorphobacter multimanifer TaxID=1070431 RepID=A0A841L8P5_9SPHN|nr:hypothetical protein [Polymorphobacter multimanifer]MBB6228800.1 hypothetical protein [Polymorphobacter multimanifer]